MAGAVQSVTTQSVMRRALTTVSRSGRRPHLHVQDEAVRLRRLSLGQVRAPFGDVRLALQLEQLLLQLMHPLCRLPPLRLCTWERS